jgi:RimJ/RimL family protein N-acetyltransferase
MFVRTERLFLRPAWPEDLDELVAVLLLEDISRMVGVAPLPATAAQVRAFLDRPRDARLPYFFIYLRAPGGAQLVGGIGLALQDGEVEVGYWISERFRGRGFAGEALRAMVSQARALGHGRLVASQVADSPAAHSVLESAGFRDTGTARSCIGPARIYVAELDRRASPRMDMAKAGLTVA